LEKGRRRGKRQREEEAIRRTSDGVGGSEEIVLAEERSFGAFGEASSRKEAKREYQ